MTGISWTDVTWNPVRGCSRVSEGCRHCYAEAQAARIVRMGKGKPTPYDGLVRVSEKTKVHRIDRADGSIDLKKTTETSARWTGKVVFDPVKLADPLRWKKPRRVFVNSMSDLFHEALTNEQIAAVFGVMAACPQHTFQVLTKRSKRMCEWFLWAAARDAAHLCLGWARAMLPSGNGVGFPDPSWPLPNVWLGVSVENQAAADGRIPDLLATPAAVRFLSCEPLLGPIDLTLRGYRIADWDEDLKLDTLTGKEWTSPRDDDPKRGPHLDWIIAGCESGPGARSCNVDWLRSLRDQCVAAGVPFFLKQAHAVPESFVTCTTNGMRWCDIVAAGEGSRRKSGGVIELPYLDGVQHAAFPEVRW